MAQEGRTFSESWHRVADLQVSLRASVVVRKQLFRGKTWYVLQDSFNNQFFRLRPEAHEFIIRLRNDRSIASVWEECLQRNPSGAPGQDDVIQLLAQLYHANLLYCDLPVDSSKLFERHQQRKQRETKAKYLSLMFYRIPLFDPEILLRHCQPLVKLLTSRLAFYLWLALFFFAGKTVIENFELVQSEAKTLLAFDNLVLLYLSMVLVKTLHEFGHTLICKRFGGEVHTIGVMLIFFTPLPYMDATSSWSFRSRRERILVASAGMIYEFFAAGLAALLWASTGPGTLHSLAFNMMFVASVSTLVFNINPLLRYDGYYILSDLLDIPNLQSRSIEQLKHLAHRYLFGDQQSTSNAATRSEAAWLGSYGLLSGVYRVIVYGGIILFIADRFLLLGLLMAVFCIFTWGIRPAIRFISFLYSSPKLQKNRPRAVAVSLLSLTLLLLSLYGAPFPKSFLAPGIVEAKSYQRVVNSSAGQVAEVLMKTGSKVEIGAPLVALNNPELIHEKMSIVAQRAEVAALLQQSMALQGGNTREMLKKRLATLDSKLDKNLQQEQDLLVTAKRSGIWVSPNNHELKGLWLARGTELGKIVSPEQFRFTAVVSQDEAANLFNNKVTGDIAVRLTGQSNSEVQVPKFDMIPFQQERLPSAALGWASGGDIPISAEDEKGLLTVEPFFRIYADLEPSEEVVLNHGHSGLIRFKLESEPLLQQILRKARQFLQKRYQT